MGGSTLGAKRIQVKFVTLGDNIYNYLHYHTLDYISYHVTSGTLTLETFKEGFTVTSCSFYIVRNISIKSNKEMC